MEILLTIQLKQYSKNQVEMCIGADKAVGTGLKLLILKQ